MTDGPTPLLALLRERTSAAHRALEGISRLARPSPTRDDYRDHLAAMWAVTHAVESSFYLSAAWEAAMPDHAERLRSELLRRDLADLGVTTLPDAPKGIPAVWTFAEGMGAAYVLEGSTLGASVLARHVRATLGDDVPLRFLGAHEGRVGPLWSAFCRTVELRIDPSSREATCHAACATFDAFKASFEAVHTAAAV